MLKKTLFMFGFLFLMTTRCLASASEQSEYDKIQPLQYALTANIYTDDVLQSSPRIVTINNHEATVKQSGMRKIVECSERQQEQFKGKKYCDESIKLVGLVRGHKDKEKVNLQLQFLIDNFEDDINISFKAQSFLNRKTLLTFVSPDSGKTYRVDVIVERI